MSDCARTLAIAAVAVIGALWLTIPDRIADGVYLNHVSGVWGALADDTARGVFYRPLLSEQGYGGTRYFPLTFFLHATLVQTGLPLLAAGHALAVASAVVLVGASALILSRFGASAITAWSLALLTLASPTAFAALGGIRGDVLPLTLGVVAVALVPRRPTDRIWPCAVVLALAMLAKPTLVWAPFAAAACVGVHLSPAKSARLLAYAAIVWLAGFVACLWLSKGSIVTSFNATALGGGLSLDALVFNLRGAFHPSAVLWIGGGLAATLLRGRRAMLEPVGAGLIVSVAVTAVVFASPGIGSNMLLDAEVLGALALGAAYLDGTSRRKKALLVMALATTLGIAESILGVPRSTSLIDLRNAAAALPEGESPVLSEQPWIPLLAGERPFLLDAFSLRQTRLASADVERDLRARLQAKRFRAVVLLGRPETFPEWYRDSQFGPDFAEQLTMSYRFHAVVGGYALYLPRGGGDAVGTVDAQTAESTYLDRLYEPRYSRVLLDWPR